MSNHLNPSKPFINKSLRPDFDYDCECGFYVCNECGYPYYPMELCYDEEMELDTCHECDFGNIVEYSLTLT